MVVENGVSVLLRGRGIGWCDCGGGCIGFDRRIVFGGLFECREEGLIGQFGWETGKVLSGTLITHAVQYCLPQRLATTAVSLL